MALTLIEGEIYRNGKRVVIPKDSTPWPVSILYGVNPSSAGPDFIPVTVDASGCVVVSDSPLANINLTYEYTYNGSYVATEKVYQTGAASGDPAKLITYTYDNNGMMLKKAVTDTTV